MRKAKQVLSIFLVLLLVTLSAPVSMWQIIPDWAGVVSVRAAPSSVPVSDDPQESTEQLLNFSKKLSKISAKAEKQFNLTPIVSNSYSTARVIICPKKGDLDLSVYPYVEMVRDPRGVYFLQFSTPAEARDCVESASKNPNVSYAEPDGIMMADREEESLFYATSASSHLSWGVSYIGADKYAEYLANNNMTSQLIVAVVDTGTSNHSFLTDKLVSGYDFVNNDFSPTDDNGHGTHVSGTVVDCTLGLNVKIMPVKVLGPEGRGSFSAIARGITYAADNSAKIINLSLGGPHDSNYMETAINYAIGKGVTVVVSAGNDTTNTSNHCPAHITEAITVSAIDADAKSAWFSNYGNAVDVCAPGVKIYSTVPDGYMNKNGTSMATPHVSACVAMLKLANPSATPAQLQTMIKQYTRDLGTSGWDQYFGNGVVDLTKAIPSTNNLSSISITTQPSQLMYYIGDSFNTSGMVVKATYANGTSKTVTGYTYSPSSFSSAGSYSVTVSYKEGTITKTASVPVTVKTPSIIVTPSTINVKINETANAAFETLPSGQSVVISPVSVSHSSSSKTSSNISFTGNSVGTDTIDLVMTYAGKQYSTRVTINITTDPKTLSYVSLQKAPTKLVYYIGDQLDLTGMRMTATYSDGTTRTVTENEFPITATLSSSGNKTVNLNYTENGITKTVSYSITVKTPSIKFSPATLDLAVGESKATTISYEPEMDLSLAESASGIAYMTVSDENEVTLLGGTKGTVVYTVKGTYKGLTYSTTLTVNVGAPMNGYEYSIINGASEVEINGYTGSGGSLNIPPTLDGLPVTSVGFGAFYNHPEITSVSIPNSVKSIGYASFYKCNNITAISIPSSVTSFDERAFQDCSKLQSISIPYSIDTLPQNTFSGCKSLHSVILPSSIKALNGGAFSHCEALTSIVIPASVTLIGQQCFSECVGLSSVTFNEPNETLTIGSFAFLNCPSLKLMELPYSNLTIDGAALGYSYDYETGTYGSTGLTICGYTETPAYEYYQANSGVVNWKPLNEKILLYIILATKPNKIVYNTGDALDTSGMNVRALYSDGSVATITDWICSPTILTTAGTQTIIVSYTENGHTKDTSFTVTVKGPDTPSINASQSTVNVKVSESATITFATIPEGQEVTLDTENLTNALALKSGSSSNNEVTISGKAPGTSTFDLVMMVGGVKYTKRITVIVEPHEHTYTATVTTEPTCQKEGEETYTCTCGDSYTKPLPKVSHRDTGNDGKCDFCGAQMTGGNHCKYCGKIHDGLFGWLVKLFHNFFAIFKR